MLEHILTAIPRGIYIQIRTLSNEAELVRFTWPAKQFPVWARSRLRSRFRFRVRLGSLDRNG